MNKIINNLIKCIIIALMGYYLFNNNLKAVKLLSLALGAAFLPSLSNKIFRFKFSNFSNYLLVAVCFFSLFLGTINNFYYQYPNFDLIIHFGAGIFFADIAVHLSLKYQPGPRNIAMIIILAVSFSMAMACIWEFYEFASDSIKNTDHQHWQNDFIFCHDMLKQPNGLNDTMFDLIANLVGCIVYQLWIFIKYK